MTDTRIPPAAVTGPYGAILKYMCRRMMGEVPDSIGILWHHRKALRFLLSMGSKAQKWDTCDENLKTFAHMAAASLIGCSACLDLGYWLAHTRGLDAAKAREVPRWRVSDVFTPLERDVMEYAEAMSVTPTAVTDELSARLLDALGAPALIELTTYIAVGNLTARANTALGIKSEGLSAACNLEPLAIAA